MSVIDSTKKEINFKIVYYGPARSGKTTSIQKLQEGIEARKKSKVQKVPKTEHTLFFDFLALSSAEIGGYKTRFQVYTVPGQELYEETRKILLKGVDGLVFVADSQLEKLQENLQSFEELGSNLQRMGISPKEIPMVIQYNKRDLLSAPHIDELRRVVNVYHVPDFETVATKNEGVVDAFKEVVSKVMLSLKE